MRFEALEQRLEPIGLGHKVLLGVGPMSLNVVDAVIEMCNILHIPMQLIASRRQIECEELGAGYVNGWTTESFARYVKSKDTSGTLMLCRDHGGPWQGANEEKLGVGEAMEKACISYEADILAGFNVIHLDPSLRDRPMSAIKRDVKKLFEHCESVPGSENVIYEVGTEETNGKTTESADFEDFVLFCKDLSPKIKFCVGQTGTLVKELRNVGSYSTDRARDLVAICNKHGLLLKEHNLDYASDEILKDHRPAGIHSVNVAPEFGTLETVKLLDLLAKYKMRKEYRKFIRIAVKSGKWEKWSISELSDEQKATICGHYVFDDPEVKEIRASLSEKIVPQPVTEFEIKSWDLDDVLKAEISTRIIKYLRSFRWLV